MNNTNTIEISEIAACNSKAELEALWNKKADADAKEYAEIVMCDLGMSGRAGDTAKAEQLEQARLFHIKALFDERFEELQ